METTPFTIDSAAGGFGILRVKGWFPIMAGYWAVTMGLAGLLQAVAWQAVGIIESYAEIGANSLFLTFLPLRLIIQPLGGKRLYTKRK